MKRFAIFSRTDRTSQTISNNIVDKLIENQWILDDDNPEIVIVIGGDGKVLRAIHKYLRNIENVSFIALNTGTLGFLTDFNSNEYEKLIETLLSDDLKEELCHLLEIQIHYENGATEKLFAINELRLEHRFFAIEVKVEIDGEYFETVDGNGVCISTPFGSTAYNRSLNGAIIDRSLPIIQLTEIAGINHRKHKSITNPVVLANDKEIGLYLKSFNNVFIGIDTQLLSRRNIHKITVKCSDKCVKMTHDKDFTLIKKLQEKYIY